MLVVGNILHEPTDGLYATTGHRGRGFMLPSTLPAIIGRRGSEVVAARAAPFPSKAASGKANPSDDEVRALTCFDSPAAAVPPLCGGEASLGVLAPRVGNRRRGELPPDAPVYVGREPVSDIAAQARIAATMSVALLGAAHVWGFLSVSWCAGAAQRAVATAPPVALPRPAPRLPCSTRGLPAHISRSATADGCRNAAAASPQTAAKVQSTDARRWATQRHTRRSWRKWTHHPVHHPSNVPQHLWVCRSWPSLKAAAGSSPGLTRRRYAALLQGQSHQAECPFVHAPRPPPLVLPVRSQPETRTRSDLHFRTLSTAEWGNCVPSRQRTPRTARRGALGSTESQWRCCALHSFPWADNPKRWCLLPQGMLGRGKLTKWTARDQAWQCLAAVQPPAREGVLQ